MMKYSQFEECIDLLTTPVENFSLTNPNHTDLLGSEDKIATNYIKPFISELKHNLLEIGTLEQKSDLIRYYVSGLMDSKNHKSFTEIQLDSDTKFIETSNNDIPPGGTKIEGMIIMGIPYSPNNDRRFLSGCNIMYHLIFDELQRCCCAFEIPFRNICLFLGFPLDTINLKISEVYTDLSHLNFLNQMDVKSTNSNVTSTPRFNMKYVSEIFDFLIFNCYFFSINI